MIQLELAIMTKNIMKKQMQDGSQFVVVLQAATEVINRTQLKYIIISKRIENIKKKIIA